MSRQLLSALVIVVLLVNLSSCRILRKAHRKKVIMDTTAMAAQPVDTTPVVSQPHPPVSEEKMKLINVIRPLYDQQIGFTTFSGKAKMHYDGKGQKQEFTANFRIRKDQVIWVQVTALGGIVQVARIIITPDSFRMINYLEKEVMQMRLSDASRILPASVDFSILQNLIVGNVLRNSGTPVDATDFGGTYTLIVDENDFTQQVAFNKADNNMRSLQIKAKKAGGPEGMIQFGNYDNVQGRKFPNSRAINVLSAGDQYYMDMNFNNANFDQNLDFPFSVPKNYTKK